MQKEAKIVGAFWIVYSVICIKYQTGILNFIIGMLIGLAYTIAYLSISLAIIKMRRKVPEPVESKLEPECLDFSPIIECFENVFKPNFGKMVYDLD